MTIKKITTLSFGTLILASCFSEGALSTKMKFEEKKEFGGMLLGKAEERKDPGFIIKEKDFLKGPYIQFKLKTKEFRSSDGQRIIKLVKSISPEERDGVQLTGTFSEDQLPKARVALGPYVEISSGGSFKMKKDQIENLLQDTFAVDQAIKAKDGVCIVDNFGEARPLPGGVTIQQMREKGYDAIFVTSAGTFTTGQYVEAYWKPDRSFVDGEVNEPGTTSMSETLVREPMPDRKAIDGMIPIGRGQRELIIEDSQPRKTQFTQGMVWEFHVRTGVVAVYDPDLALTFVDDLIFHNPDAHIDIYVRNEASMKRKLDAAQIENSFQENGLLQVGMNAGAAYDFIRDSKNSEVIDHIEASLKPFSRGEIKDLFLNYSWSQMDKKPMADPIK